ncbi:invasion associated locus B family protein [Yoonia sp. BS5-3]|uniref:Invasion associated locus B family protein n=1 Tax=Yoonia phaeophyticola TaxID=3137369 RepID=A0ABZ2V556_9RHOB
MRSITTAVTLAACLVFTGMASAQETQAAEEEAPAAPTDLDLGEPVGPQIGQPYVLQTFGDWEMRCIKQPEGEDEPCNLYQLLRDDSGAAVAEFNMFRLPEGNQAAAGATIVVPLETFLPAQLTLSVDGLNARRYPFTFCNAAGCVVRAGFTAEEVEAFKRGATANVRLVPAADPSAEVNLAVSLTGFTAGFDGVVTLEE